MQVNDNGWLTAKETFYFAYLIKELLRFHMCYYLLKTTEELLLTIDYVRVLQ
jgi:hypothetical protein